MHISVRDWEMPGTGYSEPSRIMRILVIGGSYFFGRWFTQITHKDHDIILLNRGNLKTDLPGVRELVCDRHDGELLKSYDLSGMDIDVVVDFCAYEKGDIEGILGNFNRDKPVRYIFISTVDVYKSGSCEPIKEDSPLADGYVSGPQGDYIRGKVALERELSEAVGKYGIKGVSVRPCVLYGPLNYAPRENIYFEWIKKAGQIIHPKDADGYWQMIYVADAAGALLKLCELPDEEVYEAYNFCTSDRISYDVFEEALKSPGLSFERVGIPVSEVEAGNIPLPFPLRKEESAFYSSERFEGLWKDNTPLKEGLLRSFNIYNS